MIQISWYIHTERWWKVYIWCSFCTSNTKIIDWVRKGNHCITPSQLVVVLTADGGLLTVGLNLWNIVDSTCKRFCLILYRLKAIALQKKKCTGYLLSHQVLPNRCDPHSGANNSDDFTPLMCWCDTKWVKSPELTHKRGEISRFNFVLNFSLPVIQKVHEIGAVLVSVDNWCHYKTSSNINNLHTLMSLKLGWLSKFKSKLSHFFIYLSGLVWNYSCLVWR